jgi:hypothetical protein
MKLSALICWFLVASILALYHFFGSPFLLPNKGAGLLVDQPVVRFDNHKQGRPIECSFRLQNGGVEPIDIFSVTGSCSCILTDSSPRTLHPGDVWDLPVAISSNTKLGAFKKHIYVSYRISGDKVNKSLVALNVVGNIIASE